MVGQAPVPTGGAGVSSPTPVAIAGGQPVAVVQVRGMIHSYTLESMQHRIDRAVAAGCSIIVIELDTPGGLITEAMEIAKYLKTLPAYGVTTVAWVNNDAYSAGIMMASACESVVMSTSAATGDAAPVSLLGSMAETERQKVLAPWLAEFRDNARVNGYSQALLHATAELGVEVYLVEHADTGEQRLVNQSDRAVMVDGEAVVAAEDNHALAVTIATASDAGAWREVRRVHDGRGLLTMSQGEAEDLGFSRGTVNDLPGLQSFLSAASVQRYPQTWAHSLAGWLNSPILRGVMFVVFLICGFWAMNVPGPVSVTLAALSLAALLVGPYVLGLAEAWELIVVVLGLLLLVVEVLFTPTFGVLGVVGLVMMLGGLVLAALPGGGGPFTAPPGPAMRQAPLYLAVMVVALVIAISGLGAIAKVLGRMPFLDRLVLKDETRGPVLAAESAGAIESAGGRDVVVEVGMQGVAHTVLRPSGQMALDDGVLVDVVASSGWVDEGASVCVVTVEGNRVEVEAS